MLKQLPLHFCFLVLLSNFSYAVDYTWNTTGAGNLTQTQYWNDGLGSTYPGTGDTAIISQGTMNVNSSTVYSDSRYHYQFNSNLTLSQTGTFRPLQTSSSYVLEYGTVSGISLNIRQTGGDFTVGGLYLGSGRVVPANMITTRYDISGGTLNALGAVLGYGKNTNSTMNISGTGTVVKTDMMVVGSKGGTGILNVYSGNLFTANYVSNLFGYGSNNTGLLVGNGAGGTGTFNLYDGKVVVPNFYRVGMSGTAASRAKGTANHTGGFFEAWEAYVGQGYGDGTMNLSGGTYLGHYDLIIGNKEGAGVLNQTGGSLVLKYQGYTSDPYSPYYSPTASPLSTTFYDDGASGTIIPMAGPDLGGDVDTDPDDDTNAMGRVVVPYGLTIGHRVRDGGSGVYNMSGGTLDCYYNVMVGSSQEPAARRADTSAVWNISGDAVVRTYAGTSGTIQPGDLNIGYIAAASYLKTLTANQDINKYIHSEVNISGGDIAFSGAIKAYGLDSHLFILGSKATIKASGLRPASLTNADKLNIDYYLDVGGASTLDISGEADIRDGLDVRCAAFISLQVPYVDLVMADSVINAGANVTQASVQGLVRDHTPYEFVKTFLDGSEAGSDGRQIVRLEFREDTPTWNLKGIYRCAEEEYIKGSLKVSGEYTNLIAIFSPMDVDTARLLENYLNASLTEKGIYFSLLNTATDYMVFGQYLNADGNAWFGWDLTAFNDANGTTIHFIGFNYMNVPEPATWGLMVLGGGCCLLAGRKRMRAGA